MENLSINELRIGNYISPLGIGITKVEGFCIWDNIIQSDNFAERELKEFQPIPLTEEWLLKFGFEKYTNNEFSFETKDFEISFLNGGLKLLCGEYAENPISLNNQKYVHQLQNLYFALTGTELTLNK